MRLRAVQRWLQWRFDCLHAAAAPAGQRIPPNNIKRPTKQPGTSQTLTRGSLQRITYCCSLCSWHMHTAFMPLETEHKSYTHTHAHEVGAGLRTNLQVLPYA